MKLPKLKYSSGIRTSQQVNFGGLNHTKAASDGEIYDMLNMTSSNYPLLSTRLKRAILSSGEDVKAVGDKWIIKGKDFIYDGEVKNEFMPLSDTPKTVLEMGAYVLIFPDKYYYNTEEDKPFAEGVETLTAKSDDDKFEDVLTDAEFKALEGRHVWINGSVCYVSYTQNIGTREIFIHGASIAEGTVIYPSKGFGLLEVNLGKGEAMYNSGNSDGRKSWFEWEGTKKYLPERLGLKEKEVVVIQHGDLELTAVVGHIGEEHLYFTDDNLFVQNGWSGETVTVSRKIPDFDCMCVCDNRLWGVCDGTIYASKLGDPKNFYVYQVLSTDSWAVDYLTKHFTGAVVYNGKPTFWTEESVITIHGSTPSTFKAYETMLNGVKDGCGRSMAVVNGYLFFLSPTGVCVYGGQYPTLLQTPIGEKFDGGFGFTDGKKYYISADTQDGKKLYVYDPSVHLWHIEDGLEACDYNVNDGYLSVVSGNGELLMFPPVNEGEPEGDFESFAEFADYYVSTGNKKAMSKVNIRLEVEEGAEVTLFVKYDSANEWQSVRTITATAKRSVYLPFVPRRCDHYRLRFEGKGGYTIYSISRENYVGSAN